MKQQCESEACLAEALKQIKQMAKTSASGSPAQRGNGIARRKSHPLATPGKLPAHPRLNNNGLLWLTLQDHLITYEQEYQ
jgi:hypothetical protein